MNNSALTVIDTTDAEIKGEADLLLKKQAIAKGYSSTEADVIVQKVRKLISENQYQVAYSTYLKRLMD